MRLLGVVLASIASATAASFERPADVDDIVLVRGSIHGCPGFPGVLAHQKVDPGSELSFFDLDPIPIYGQTADQIRAGDPCLHLRPSRDDPFEIASDLVFRKT
jgi:hypothetical protein